MNHLIIPHKKWLVQNNGVYEKSYQIITDSCCDLTREQMQQLNIACADLTLLYKGETHSNFSDPAAVKAFYDEIRSGTQATTAAANPDAEYLLGEWAWKATSRCPSPRRSPILP